MCYNKGQKSLVMEQKAWSLSRSNSTNLNLLLVLNSSAWLWRAYNVKPAKKRDFRCCAEAKCVNDDTYYTQWIKALFDSTSEEEALRLQLLRQLSKLAEWVLRWPRFGGGGILNSKAIRQRGRSSAKILPRCR